MTSNKDSLSHARDERSKRKRQAVEQALTDMKRDGEKITFQALAKRAGVSRPYLYNNFKEEISKIRQDDRDSVSVIDGINVPKRTPDEYQHIEAVLRNKIKKLKNDLGGARSENARLKQALERSRGEAENFRQNWINSRDK